MDAEKVIVKEMKVIGAAIRTTNRDGQSIRDQSVFWQRFFMEKMSDKIPCMINPGRILGLYTDYESDFMGAYTFIIGHEVDSIKSIPEGMIGVTVPAGTYSLFTSSGKMSLPEKVGLIWQSIWKSGINRSYQLDFEVYDLVTMQTDNPEVNIYIGIK